MDEVKKTENKGVSEYHRLNKEAKKLGVDTEGMDTDQIIEAIQRKQIAITERIRAEEREKLQQEYKLVRDRSELIAESESLGIVIDLPEPCTETDLAKARRKLGLEKTKAKPSPETLAIDASKKWYYIFRNLEQDDVDVTCCPGGKYRIHLVPNEIHVLSEYHIKFFRQKAVTPVYDRVPSKDGKRENTQKVGEKQRFTFEPLDVAPQDAEFGVVHDETLKAKLLNKELV